MTETVATPTSGPRGLAKAGAVDEGKILDIRGGAESEHVHQEQQQALGSAKVNVSIHCLWGEGIYYFSKEQVYNELPMNFMEWGLNYHVP